ncbi:acyl-CoA dehydrogenase family protein [Lewinella cohaerens]|uniref:acyl-CoA dehydrogenase family protein n=1 Tax=Lewinella cohaerens TaxID=70995 RepID=UPI00037680C5|nr:acyl-CoA dehydrogenase family protein [Lewinella cohaerens]
MIYEYSENTNNFRKEIIAFAQEYINPEAALRDQEARFDQSLWKKCAEIGLTSLSLPADFGGRGLSAYDTVLALEALGYGSEDPGLNFALAAQLLAVATPIAEFASPTQQENWLPKLISGDAIGGNAMTEESAGSDVFFMKTTAKLDKEAYLLNGTKTFCTNGQAANLVLTYALTAPEKGFFGGISAFVIDTDEQKTTWSEPSQKLGLRSCPLASINFSETSVPANQLIGKEGAGAHIFNHSMRWERTCLGAIHLGAMDRLLEQAVQFANQRFSGKGNLSSHQAVTHPLTNLKVELEGARLLTYHAARMLDAGEHKSHYAAMAKLSVSECYRKLCLQLMQLFAGQAYRTPHPVELQLRAALGATIYSGTSEIQRELIARQIGFRPRDAK